MTWLKDIFEDRNYLIMILVIVLGFVFLKLVLYLIISNLLRLARTTKNNFDDILARGLRKIRWPFLLILSLWLATKYLNLPLEINKTFDALMIAIATWTAIKISNVIIREAMARQQAKIDGAKPLAGFFSVILKIILGLIGLLLILSSLGVNVSSLATGLGLSSVVLIFALQNVLLDIFSALSLFLDKPFQVDDFIAIGADKGWVKKIGLRSTRLETIDGQKIIISNRLVTGAVIYNLETVKEQLVKFTLKLDYKTSSTNCRAALKLIKEAIASTEYARFKQAHWLAFGDSALIYETAYWVKGADAKRQLDVQQAINFKIKRSFEQSNINLVH